MFEIYSTTHCHYCQLAKQYFTKNLIDYVEYNVGNDINKRKEMVELSGQMGVPVIKYGDKFMVGWNEDEFNLLCQNN